jgi:hypothetical protein
MLCKEYLDPLTGFPINATSNVAYFSAALILFITFYFRKVRSDFYFGIFAAIVGLASSLFHIYRWPIFYYFDYAPIDVNSKILNKT